MFECLAMGEDNTKQKSTKRGHQPKRQQKTSTDRKGSR